MIPFSNLSAAQTPSGGTLRSDRMRVAADIAQLRLLSTHIPFDTTHLRWTAGAVRAVQDRVASLTSEAQLADDQVLPFLALGGWEP